MVVYFRKWFSGHHWHSSGDPAIVSQVAIEVCSGGSDRRVTSQGFEDVGLGCYDGSANHEEDDGDLETDLVTAVFETIVVGDLVFLDQVK